MKHIVRTLVFIVLTLIIAQTSHAQISPRNVQELMSYFDVNIQHLDPIEGVYDVNIEQWGENAYRQFPPETTNITMLIYKDKSGVFRAFKNEQVTIKRIGATAIYNYNLFWTGSNVTDSKRFVLEGNSIFNVKYSIPDRQLRYDMGRNYQAGFKVNFKCSFIKTYPTPDMYTDNDVMESPEVDEAKWSGTGFALNNGYIVTNYHVIDNAKSIYIQGVKGDFVKKYRATIIAADKYNDLALLRIDDGSFNGFGSIPYKVKTSVSDVGEEVFVLGYPLTSTMGDEIKLTTGVISSKTGFQGDVSLYQISAPIQPGNSGGPLFDNRGNLIGVVNAKHKGAENVGYAIKTSYLNNLIESSISTSILPNNNQIAGLPLTGKVKNLKNYVFMITCSNAENSNMNSHNRNDNLNNDKNTYDKSDIVIHNPAVSSNTLEDDMNYTVTKISRVIINDKHTIVELSLKNYVWCQIDPQSYIVANGRKYTLKNAEGIALAPQKTYPSYRGGDIDCKLYFPPIPKNITSIDFIESQDSRWKFYGIKIR